MLPIDLSEGQLLDAAPDAMLVVDEAGTIILVNAQTESLFGYSREDLLGQPVEVLVPDRFRRRHLDHRTAFFDKPRQRAIAESQELYGRHKDGSEFQIEVSLNPVRSDQGLFVVSAIRDISQRVRDLRNLKAKQEFADHLVDTLDGIVLALDTEGRITLFNSYAAELTGYKEEEVLGRDWFDTFIPDEERQTIRAYFNEVMQVGMNRGYTNDIVLKNGERRQIHWLGKTLVNPDGQIDSLVSTGHDVSELAKAKEIAEAATVMKTRFLAAASHDLRQPLQSLRLYLSVLTRQLTEPKILDVCNKMDKSLETMRELLDALLDISRLDGGTVTPEKRDFSIQDLLDRIVADNIQQAAAKGLQLACTGANCIVHTDPGLLERVLENFVTNAIRYTEKGQVSIDCQQDGKVARISVADTGVGIPEEDLGKVFEEYYQLDNQVRDRRKGLGLGLAIAKHIARLLGHRIDVTSTPGEGSTFSLEVPLGEPIAVATPVAKPIAQSREPIVLLVDDDPVIVDATRMLLETSGIDVHSASCGDDALAHLAAGVKPDIVISDFRLPGYDGVELIRRMRKAADTDLPTILMTGDTSGDEIEAANLPNCTVLHKPVDTDRLIELIGGVAI